MKVLGIYDWHNSCSALVEDGKVLAAMEEERLTRNKIEFGLPYKSIDKIMEMTKTSWDDIDAIAIAGIRDPVPFARWKTSTFKFKRKMGHYWNLQYTAWRALYNMRNITPLPSLEKMLNRRIMLSKFRKLHDISGDKIHMIDHHLCHASTAYRGSGFDKAIIFAIDGSGDGYSTTVFKGENGDLTFLAGSSEKASFGKLYSNVTLGLGFSKISGEGKVMGLAACGDPDKFYEHVENVITVKDADTLNLSNSEDLLGNSYAKKIRNLSKHYSREDISAAVQQKLENDVKKIVTHFVEKTGIRNVAVAGGVASNVKMNQMIRELDCVDNFFVFPNMTDGGLAVGAALEVDYILAKKDGKKRRYSEIGDMYLGPSYDNDQIRDAIRKNGLEAEFVKDIDGHVGDLVSKGRIVARFDGRMEYGPRALGNRSILVLPTEKEIEDILNERLQRDEFMPFAPSMIEKNAIKDYLVDGTRAPYMVITFETKPGVKEAYPAIVHVDNTCRPQTVDKTTNKGYRRILDTVGENTGHYLVLNTSFNMHGEPIVCSPQDAINTYKQKCVDYLAIGNYLLRMKN